MPNYMLRLSFVGTNYCGWQIQPDKPTIQGELKRCIERIVGEKVKLVGCCRTDAGVHASDYVANFMCDRDVEADKLLKGLNGLLPRDIGILSVSRVEDSFNARFSVKGKTYLYRIFNFKGRDPFLYPFSWHIPMKLDIDTLVSALELISGEHDFRGFSKVEDGKKYTIELQTELKVKGPVIEMRFTASHFLRYMVRRLVGTCIEASKGKISIGSIKDFLSGKKSPFTAPPKGLTLEKVHL